MIPPIADVIQDYHRAVFEKRVHCDLARCPLGERCPGDEFRLHDRRNRTFLYVVERLVHKASCLLSRWKCLVCGGTFTLYPSFALPYKRYVAETICGLGERYVEEDALSYRKAVREQGLPVFHAGKGEDEDGNQREDRDEDENAAAEPTLQHSTLYRWLALFAALVRTRREALRLIRAKSSGSSVFRRISPVAPRKYRSDERRRLLQRARQLFVAEREYRAVLENSIFPRLATLCSWT